MRADRRRTIALRLAVALIGAVAAAVAFADPSVHAKGPVVRAPAELGAADCVPGSRAHLGRTPREERWYRNHEVLVLGCATMSGGERVLVAAERDRLLPVHPKGRVERLICFYAVREGRHDADPVCPYARRSDAEGARERHGPRVESPLLGDEGIGAPSARRVHPEGPIYLFGNSSADIASVTVSYRASSGWRRESRAELIPISGEIAGRLGGRYPFAYFVGEIPADADTCARITVNARDRRGHVVDRRSETRFNPARFRRAYPTAPLALPRSRRCPPPRAVGGELGRLLGVAVVGWGALRLAADRLARLLGVP